VFLIKNPCASRNVTVPEAIDIDVTFSADTSVVTVVGELDLSNTAHLGACLHGAIDAGACDIALDLSRLTYMDSTGVSVLDGIRTRLQAVGGTLAIIAVTPIVAKLLSVTRGVPRPAEHRVHEPRTGNLLLVASSRGAA
jgi:anti-sigma B factor antagonist